MRTASPFLAAFLLALAAGTAAAQEQELPRLSGHVVDEAEILSPETEDRLIRLLSDHEAAAGNQVVLVTLSSLRGHDVSDYARRLCLYWQGETPEQHCGVLLIVVPAERAVRIEVAQELAAALTEETRRTIVQREIVPFFQGDELTAGIEHGLRGILAALAGGYIPPPDQRPEAFTRTLGVIVSFTVSGLYLVALIYALVRRRRRSVAAVAAIPAGDEPLRAASERW
jgi:uncharacterized membrane protein YgcG